MLPPGLLGRLMNGSLCHFRLPVPDISRRAEKDRKFGNDSCRVACANHACRDRSKHYRWLRGITLCLSEDRSWVWSWVAAHEGFVLKESTLDAVLYLGLPD